MEADFQLDNSWTLSSIAGGTGKTYMGTRQDEKVFIKQNTTPFLAVLSQEGITPKLLWTKRMGTGDVLTAQEWLEGKTLTAAEVAQNKEIIQILHRLHHSESLENMLLKVGGKQKAAFDFLEEYATNLPNILKHNQYLYRVFRYLEDHMPNDTKWCVCHGDPVHQNWYVSNDHRLYLVDWDNCVLADPAVDIAVILGRYIPDKNWETWLKDYGLEVTEELLQKIHWYVGMFMLSNIKQYHEQFGMEKMNHEINLLKKYFKFE